MSVQQRPDELIRLLRPEFAGRFGADSPASLTWGKIMLVPPAGAPVKTYPVTVTGLLAALTAATVAGSMVWVPPGTFNTAIAIPANIALVALGEKTSINGQWTLNSGVVVANIVQTQSGSSAGALSGVVGPSSGIAYMKNCSINVENSGVGDAYSVNQSGAGELWLWGCATYGNATGGGSGYGARQSAGTLYVSDDGRHRGSTGKFSGTVQLFSFDDVIRLKTPGGFTKLFNGDAAGVGLTAALAASSNGDTIHLPLQTIAGNHTIPAGIHLDGVEGSELTGTIIANPGVTISSLVKIPNLLWWDAPNAAPGGTLNLLSTPVTIISIGNHNGFPNIARLSNGDLMVVYRDAADHSASKGVIKYQTSSDEGDTWSAQSTIFSDATYDCRDPGIVVLDSGRIVVSFFKWDYTGSPETWANSGLADAVHTTYSDNDGSSWSAPVALNSSFQKTGSPGNPILLPDGTLRLAQYGVKDPGDTYRSISIFTSSDNGESWDTEILVADGEEDSRLYEEMVIEYLHTGEILGLIRSDTTNQFFRTISRDTGLTWTDPVAVFSATGKPFIYQLKNGIVITIYRATADGQADYRISRDNGYSWEDAGELHTTSGVRMAYAGAVEYDEGILGVVVSDEDTSSDANLLFYRFYTTIEGGQLVSNVPDGTAPIAVDSTTLVNNLNVDKLDGFHASEITSQPTNPYWEPAVVDAGDEIMFTDDGDVAMFWIE